MEIQLTEPKTLTLSPQTIATTLDALANHGPWKMADAALKEFFSQLQPKPPQQEQKPDEPITDQ